RIYSATLLFSSCSQQRDLHVRSSFPTRRSSDLAGEVLGQLAREPAPAGDEALRPLLRHAPAQVIPALLAALAAEGGSERPRVREDRKSTRLNSSHVKISYAVFCLKKKIHLYENY